MNSIENIVKIRQLISEVDAENPKIGMILLEGFNLSLRCMQAVGEKNQRENLDIGEYIEIMARALDVDLKEIIIQCFKETNEEQVETQKEADKDTLDFITSTAESAELDDYEKFVAQNKAKESLDFLSKEL